ncbi:hypothetical protein BN1708_018973, partial [Verticillium longisporum]
APAQRQLAQCHPDSQGRRRRKGKAHQDSRERDPDRRARKGPGRLRQIPGYMDQV